jgi:K+-sensing histidine kinase KdpD
MEPGKRSHKKAKKTKKKEAVEQNVAKRNKNERIVRPAKREKERKDADWHARTKADGAKCSAKMYS